MPHGGTLLLSAAREMVAGDGPEHPESLDPGYYVRLSVRDSGIGMDAATLARASEPFFTTKSSGHGTGLGLAMSKGFAEQSGGAMRIESAPGQGTTVTLWLPETDPQELHAAAFPRELSAIGASRLAEPAQAARVLLVDDQDAVREVLEMSLRDAGYSVLAASNGIEALALLSAGDRADAVVTDLSMPGMDGLALIRAVHAQHPKMPAILLTGYTGEGAALAVGQSVGGPFALLRKPVHGQQLVDCLAALLVGRVATAQ
jgi:CheY-like chemotaxis protein